MAANFDSNYMFRNLKKILCALLGFAAIQHASGFSIFGPAETWQTPVLDYLTRYFYSDTEGYGPKNFDEGSRLNVPIVTYAFDYTFLDYFGAEGVAAVDSAMAKMNSLPRASSAKLSKFLTQDNQGINYTAQALELTDLKSTVITLMLEHMGLAGETHVWDLRGRAALPGGGFEYVVINRSYDPVTYNPSAYVNGVNYTYFIQDGSSIGVDVADAIEIPVDLTSPAHFTFTAAATIQALQPGGYFLGITRDDMGGLAYLYRQKNYAYEVLDTNSIIEGLAGSWDPYSTNVIDSVTNAGFQGLFGGAEKITYVKLNYNSLLGAGFTPITYHYSITVVTNGAPQTLHAVRTITQPDILFTAADLISAPTAFPIIDNEYTRGFGFINSGLVSLGGGVTASVITPQELITFNNVTPVYYNETPSFLDQLQNDAYPVLLWGSFDGSTNAPIVYPNDSSLEALLDQVLEGGATVPPGNWNPFSTNSGSTNASPISPL
jgi:hypothetical protein